ncbi:uncharacterized hydrophobic domain-containing protein [Paenimyroides ummariense]|uniref:Uncharacterized hydrophobic domain-containing protein n=1 Tax=Paenimyroides ummariense TaxID=913024 RepID=A0A1I5FPU6_9FLAO|nr:uncharacterized hydrophobic domain-containing protein [Paenimyroides ummariense]
MGPILGAGFALGTYNFRLLRKSIKNLLIATVVSLTVSALYFYISPFKDVQLELLARTSPNIYDVLIAFFGGLVGVIAITRVEKGNPIPGVAIATALMPPLCTAGYGLATLNASYLGAFYLYTINCFFICIATFFVIKYLKYPAAAVVDPKNAKKIRYGITTLMMLMIIPSFYLAYNLFQEKRFTKTVDEFINLEFGSRGYTVIYQKLNYNSNPKTVDIAFLNKKLTLAEMKLYNRMLADKGVRNTVLNFRQDDADLKSEILKELGKQDHVLTEKDLTINNLRTELNRYKVEEPGLRKEMEILFPELQSVTLGKIERYAETDSAKMNWLVLYRTQNEKETADSPKIKQWLSERLKTKNILLINESTTNTPD